MLVFVGTYLALAEEEVLATFILSAEESLNLFKYEEGPVSLAVAATDGASEFRLEKKLRSKFVGGLNTMELLGLY